LNSVKSKASAKEKPNDNEPKPTKTHPIRIEMHCKAVPCRFEISHQVPNDGLG